MWVEQVEFATCVILNKVDFVIPTQLNHTHALLHTLNPTARQETCTLGAAPLDAVLRTWQFSFSWADRFAAWKNSGGRPVAAGGEGGGEGV